MTLVAVVRAFVAATRVKKQVHHLSAAGLRRINIVLAETQTQGIGQIKRRVLEDIREERRTSVHFNPPISRQSRFTSSEFIL